MQKYELGKRRNSTPQSMGCSSGKYAVSDVNGKGNAYLNESTIALINYVFAAVDGSGDGKLTIEECVPGLKQCGFEISTENLYHIVNLVDDNNDGKMNKAEFMRCVICLTLAETKDPAPYILFVAADKDLSKKISKKEFEKACEKLKIDEIVGKDKLKEVIKSVKEELDINDYIEKLDEFRQQKTE